jgi:hypothetical protein
VLLLGRGDDLGVAISQFEHDPGLVDPGAELDVGEHAALLVQHLDAGPAEHKGLDAIVHAKALLLSDHKRTGKAREVQPHRVGGPTRRHPARRRRRGWWRR